MSDFKRYDNTETDRHNCQRIVITLPILRLITDKVFKLGKNNSTYLTSGKETAKIKSRHF